MEAEPVQQSLLAWLVMALGPLYLILLPLVGLVSFILALVIVMRGRGPMAAASLVLIVNAPLLIGVFAAIQGTLASYRVIAMSTTTPKPAELAVGISLALVAPMVAMLLAVPGYATAAIGGFIRSISAAEAKRA